MVKEKLIEYSDIEIELDEKSLNYLEEYAKNNNITINQLISDVLHRHFMEQKMIVIENYEKYIKEITKILNSDDSFEDKIHKIQSLQKQHFALKEEE